MNLGLQDRNVLVTGSTSGIGKAIARAYLAEGARVVLHGLTQPEADGALAELAALGATDAIGADISTAAGAAQLVEAAGRRGKIDILVNNVGIFSARPFAELTDEDWQKTFDVNVMSAVRLGRAVLPDMLARNCGAIVNIASEAGVKPLPLMVHYSTSKTAVIGLTRGMAELTRATAVRVNSVLPGPTWTEGVERYFQGLAAQDGRPLQEIVADYFRREEPTSLIQRFIEPDEVARLVVFLSAQTAMNGGAYRVEGGIIRSIL
jgi:NAD(P)-dependent dehydrogenase (short-subunit alcohol dehydrogenase family)